MNPNGVQQTLAVLGGLPAHPVFSNQPISIVVTTQDAVDAFGASIQQMYLHQKNPTYVTTLLGGVSDLYALIVHKSMRGKFVLESWAARLQHQLDDINRFVSNCESRKRSHRLKKQHRERKAAKRKPLEARYVCAGNSADKADSTSFYNIVEGSFKLLDEHASVLVRLSDKLPTTVVNIGRNESISMCQIQLGLCKQQLLAICTTVMAQMEEIARSNASHHASIGGPTYASAQMVDLAAMAVSVNTLAAGTVVGFGHSFRLWLKKQDTKGCKYLSLESAKRFVSLVELVEYELGSQQRFMAGHVLLPDGPSECEKTLRAEVASLEFMKFYRAGSAF